MTSKRRFLILFLVCVTATADTATVVSTSDNTLDSWVTSACWDDIDDDIDSPDGAVCTSPTNPASTANDVIFNVTCPANTGTITEANLRVRARKSAASGRTIDFTASWSATASTTYSQTNISETMTNSASGNQTGLSISKATCNSSTVKIAPTTGGSGAGRTLIVDAINLDIVYTAGAARNRVAITAGIKLNPNGGM